MRVRLERDDEFDTLARSLVRSSDRNCRLETERTSEKGGAPDKRRIIGAVDKAISTTTAAAAATLRQLLLRSDRFRRGTLRLSSPLDYLTIRSRSCGGTWGLQACAAAKNVPPPYPAALRSRSSAIVLTDPQNRAVFHNFHRARRREALVAGVKPPWNP